MAPPFGNYLHYILLFNILYELYRVW